MGYTWDVIDQNGQTVQTYNTHQNSITLNNTSHTTDLTYTIRLTVGDPSTGCDSILTSDTIVVFHNPDAGFTVSPTQLCAPGFVTVNDTSVTGDNLSYVYKQIQLLRLQILMILYSIQRLLIL